MSLRTLLRQQGTVIHRSPGPAGPYGDRALAETGRDDYACFLQPRQTQEILVGRETRISDYVLFLPAGAEITALDLWLQDGVTYEVLGEPRRESSPRGEHHVEADLRRFGG